MNTRFSSSKSGIPVGTPASVACGWGVACTGGTLDVTVCQQRLEGVEEETKKERKNISRYSIIAIFS